jgi:hypothetical protein
MKRLLFATLAVLSCSVGASAHAANLTPQAIRKSLASAGYGAELLPTDTEGHALIRTGTEMRTAMHLNGCTKAGCTNVLIRAYFNNEHKLQTGDLNRINAAMRWIKVYLDEDGDVAVEMDVDLPKNASNEIPATALKRFGGPNPDGHQTCRGCCFTSPESKTHVARARHLVGAVCCC